jgi:hypothetical protein
VPRNPEEHIRAAIASGRIPKSRAEYWRQRGREGLDLAVLDTMAAVPGLSELAAATVQDDDDQVYDGLFGKDPGGRQPGRHADASTTQTTEDQIYDYMFGPRPDEPPSAEYTALFPEPGQERAAVDAHEAAAAKAVGALSDMELYREMFGEDPK